MSYFLIFIFAIILEFNISNPIKRDVKRLLRDINNKNFTISSMDDKLKNNQTHSENFYELNLFVNLSESFRLKLYDVFINYIEWNDARIKRFKYI